MVLAKIGSYLDTISDRAIRIHLARKLARDRVERLPIDINEQCLDLRRKCQRWANDNATKLERIKPTLLDIGNDRAVDNWHLLLAVAELIGSDILELARSALLVLESSADSDNADDLPIMLLRDMDMLTATRHKT